MVDSRLKKWVKKLYAIDRNNIISHKLSKTVLGLIQISR